VADHRYHTSPERAALEPNPARLIEEQTVRRLVDVAPRPASPLPP